MLDWRSFKKGIQISILLLTPLLLSSCSSMRLYNAVKDQQAKNSITLLNQAELDKTAVLWEDNLDKYLAREVDAIDRVAALVEKNTLWRLSSGKASMADLYLEAEERLKNLGFAKISDVSKYINLNIAQEERQGQLKKYRNNLEILIPQLFSSLPDCEEGIPIEWSALKTLPEQDLADDTKTLYQLYYTYCREILNGDKNFLELGGEVATVRERRIKIKRQIDIENKKIAQQKDAIAKAKQMLAKAVDSEKREQKNLAKYSDKLISLLEKEESKYSEAPEEVIRSINSLLGNLQAEGEARADPLDKDIYVAAVVAKSTPALSDAMSAYINNGYQPNFTDLVLELNRQLLLRDYHQTRQTLLSEQLMLAENAEQLLLKQANADYKVATELCLFSFSQKQKDACKESFMLKSGGNAESHLCGFEQYQSDCPLNTLFSDAWKTSKGEKKIHLLKMLAAFSDSNFYSSEFAKNEFKRSDLTLRNETIASKSAVLQWSNLLRIPTEELASFYGAGVKPEELSELIVKVVTIAGLALIAGQK